MTPRPAPTWLSLSRRSMRTQPAKRGRDGADTVVFPQDLIDRMHTPDVERAVNGERKQFETRRSARDGQRSQLRERIVQLNDEMRGYQAQIVSRTVSSPGSPRSSRVSMIFGRRTWCPTRA